MDDSPYPPQQAQPTRPKWLMPLLIAVAVLLVLAGGAVAWTVTRNASLRVAATLVLSGVGVSNIDDHRCEGTSGYEDINANAQVVITDADGKTIGTTTIGEGALVGIECRFSFSLDVPGGEDFYGIEVAHRGRLQFPEADMRGGLQLTLGS